MMAVSKTAILLLPVLVLFYLSACAKEKTKGTLIWKLTTFQKIAAMCVEKKLLAEDQIKEMSVDVLKSNLITEYKNVRCSYLAACLTYLQTVSGLLSLSLQREDYKRLVSNYYLGTIVQESSRMVATSVNEAELSTVKELMWIFHLYALWLYDRFYGANYQVTDAVFLPAQQALWKLLKRAIYFEDCPRVLKEHIDLKSMTTMPAEPNDIRLSMQLFSSEYKLSLSRQLKEYDRTRLMSLAGWTSCNMRQLCLNYIVSEAQVLDDLQVKFGMKHPVILNVTLKSIYDKVCVDRTLPLADTINELSSLQYNFVQMLKAIMVRIILYYIYWEENSHKRLYNREILKLLKDFAVFLDLNDDEHMKTLVGLFDNQQCNPLFCYKNSLENGIDDLFGILDDIAKSFLLNLPSYVIRLTEEMPENEQTERRKMINSIKIIASTIGMVLDKNTNDLPERVFRVLVFLRYLKKKLYHINFKIIRNFYNIPKSKAYLRLLEIQSVQANQI